MKLFPLNQVSKKRAIASLSPKSKKEVVQLALSVAKLDLGDNRDVLAEEAIAATEEWLLNPNSDSELRAYRASLAFSPRGFSVGAGGGSLSKYRAASYAALAASKDMPEAAILAVDSCVAAYYRQRRIVEGTLNEMIGDLGDWNPSS